jgi:membrane protein implicated in regulation of membrane protease activity
MVSMSAWLVWLIIAVILAGAEMLSLDLVLIMLAGGAAAGALAGGLGAPLPIQIAIAAATSLGLLFGVRPVAKAHLTRHGEIAMNTDGLVGKTATVLAPVDQRTGRVALNGGEWSARTFDPTQTIPVGATVRVMEITGATAVVWEEHL